MNTRGKWLARSGALLVLLGFVLPSLTVSCGGFREMGTTLSLAQLAERAEQPLLYLSPLCILVLLAASWLPAISRQAAQRNLIVQAAGWGVSLLGLLISFLALNSQLGQYGAIDISPEYGIGILLGGYGLSVIGLYLQWREEITAFGVTAGSWQVPESAYPAAPPPPVFEPPPPLAAGPRLELVQGALAAPVIPLEGTDLLLGRSRECDIYIPDAAVSRRHARLRFAQDAWFIQDQESRGGTYVNGQLVQAMRLKPGDQLTIGEHTFILRE